jgi:hypothetical protein
VPTAIIQSWSMDLMHDQLADGRSILLQLDSRNLGFLRWIPYGVERMRIAGVGAGGHKWPLGITVGELEKDRRTKTHPEVSQDVAITVLIQSIKKIDFLVF